MPHWFSILFFALSLVITPSWAGKSDSEPRRREVVHDDAAEEQCSDEIEGWRDTNNLFWKGIGAEAFNKVIEFKGLDTHVDFRQAEVQRLLGRMGNTAPVSVAVIGAGYGRDLDYLCRETDIPLIHAIEVANGQVRHLRRRFDAGGEVALEREAAGKPRQEVKIYEANAGEQGVLGRDKVNLVLWTFAGVLELSPSEKRGAIRNIHQFTHSGGMVVVDVPVGRVKSHLQITQIGNTISVQGSGGTSLHLHPINFTNGEVDLPRLKSYFEKDNRFLFFREQVYGTEGAGAHPRRLLFFYRP